VYSELSNDVEFVVVGVFPQSGVREVGVVHKLTSSLSPSHGFTLSVTPEHSRI